MPFWLWKPRRHSRSRAKSRFPKCLRAPRAGAFLSAGRKNFNSLPEKFVVRVDKSCQGEYNKRNITKMAVKRRVSFRMSLTRKPGGWKRAGRAEWKMVSEPRGRRGVFFSSLRRVRPLPRRAGTLFICQRARLCLQRPGEPRWYHESNALVLGRSFRQGTGAFCCRNRKEETDP